jgi:branched-chain amino acid aminotransferase
MSQKVYINGRIVEPEDAKLSVFDHGFLYGDGVFEGLRIYGRKVFRLKEHLDRLFRSAAAISLNVPMPADAIAVAIDETLRAGDVVDGYVRLIVTRGAGTLGLDPNRTSDPQVIVIAGTIALYPREFYEEGMSIVTAKTIRNHPQALNPCIKSLNYLNNILAKLEGLAAGCTEALMLNHRGEVAECTTENIFLVTAGELITPPTDAGALEGITRAAVMELAGDAGHRVRETTVMPADVLAADECFLTGSAAEIVPVVSLDGTRIGTGKPGPVTRDLMRRYHELTQQ